MANADVAVAPMVCRGRSRRGDDALDPIPSPLALGHGRPSDHTERSAGQARGRSGGLRPSHRDSAQGRERRSPRRPASIRGARTAPAVILVPGAHGLRGEPARAASGRRLGGSRRAGGPPQPPGVAAGPLARQGSLPHGPGAGPRRCLPSRWAISTPASAATAWLSWGSRSAVPSPFASPRRPRVLTL